MTHPADGLSARSGLSVHSVTVGQPLGRAKQQGIWPGGAVPPQDALAGHPHDGSLTCEGKFLILGAPGRIRTRDPLLRRYVRSDRDRI